ncbi:MAG: ATP-binding protein [Pseudomonadota bacterium]
MTKEKQNILVVDDEKDIVDALYDTFSDKYNVFRALNANEAMEVLGHNEIDLVISDQRMPGMTGVELFARINENYPLTGKVLLTGYADLHAVVDAINKGDVDKYISKPWDDRDITGIVLEVLNIRLNKSLEERKRVESQLVQNAKMASLGELVAGIAHELNNPLGFIYANMGNLKKFSQKLIGLIEGYDQADIPAAAREELENRKKEINYDYLRNRMVEMIERSAVGAERMKKIIQDLKAFSRLDSAEVTEADINKAIETTLGLMVHEYKNRIGITKEFGVLPPVECFIAKLNQVFMNLLVNACHAIEDQGEIRIKTRTENGWVRIDISDTGKGIPEDIIGRIFDPFFTTKPVGKGTGLGLSITHGIIRQHKGEISAVSSPGKGTTFTIKIPLRMEEVTEG